MWSVLLFFKEGKTAIALWVTPSTWTASSFAFFIPTKVNSLQTELAVVATNV